MLNRRSFLSSLLKGAVSATILPSAITYNRVWKQVDSLIIPEETIIAFNQLPFYLVKNEIKTLSSNEYQAWEFLFKDINWESNLSVVNRTV